MGYDIWADGQFQVEKSKRDEALAAIRKAIAENPNARQANYKSKFDENDPISSIDLYFLSGHFEETEDGHLVLHFGDDSTRHEEYDKWLFEAAAPFCDPADEIQFKGEDGYQWAWRIEGGKLIEVCSGTVWGKDIEAPEVLQKIIELVYPGGKPASSLPDYDAGQIMDSGHSACLSLIEAIESLLREHGFGPQAGMNELERMADV